ncbi:MAG TPA: hypothetical protein VE263_16500 [Candidatus Angelobacter sp.]|nr:hypothetical protein [Candidatus Angelobacter sp.]
MNRSKTLSFLTVLLLAALALSSCSGPKGGVICTVNCGGGPANLSFTLVADTLPAHPSLLSFKVIVTGITVTSSTKTTTLTPPSAAIDLMRLQSDSAFLGTLTNVPSETISSLTVAIAVQQLTFFNDTGVALTSPVCAINAICSFNPGTVGAVLINNVNQIFSSNTGFGLDFNLNNAITITGTTLNVTLNPAGNLNILTSFLLPRTGSNLSANQLDLIEDFTGVVTVNGQNATITNPITNVTLTAAATTSSTNFDPDPTGALCPTGTKALASCVANSQIASMDAVLNSDGTLSIREIEPLLATQQDLVEGIVFSVPNTSSTQFTILTTNKLETAAGTLVGPLNIGDFLTVNLSNAPTFLVDRKGLNVLPGDLGNFTNGTTTAVLRLGQAVMVHVTAFTPAGVNFASATVDTVTLRGSRFTASVSQTLTTSTFNITGFPSFFFATGTPTVQAFAGTPGGDGITNFDGITDASGLSTTKAVALRALFIENATNSSQFPFYAAKVRQH